MRVLYLIDSLMPGGAERSLLALAPQYAKLDIDLEVVYLHERDGLRAALEASGAHVHALAGRGAVGHVRAAAAAIKSSRPDVVHTTLFEADIVGRVASIFTGAPVVCSLVNTNYGPEHRASASIMPWKLRAAQVVDTVTARRVRRFHAVSSTVAEEMTARLRLRRDRVEVIPRGRDAAALGQRTEARRAAARAGLAIAPGQPLLLAAGRQEHQKGFDTLLTAFATVRRTRRDARLVIAGREGAASASLRTLVESLALGDAVQFVGTRDDVPDLLCAADVFVFPSRWEGMPGGVIEAMALEVPIVASDIAPVREVLGDAEVARLVAPDDPAALAVAIGSALDEPECRRTDAGRQRFLAHFTIERVALQMREFYGRALGHE